MCATRLSFLVEYADYDGSNKRAKVVPILHENWCFHHGGGNSVQFEPLTRGRLGGYTAKRVSCPQAHAHGAGGVDKISQGMC